jgi:glucokinase
MRQAVADVWDDGVSAIGVGAAGLVETGTGRVRYAPNIAWREVDIAAVLSGFDVAVRVDNDCTVATVGELLAGAGRDVPDFLYVGVGTGIGGGIVCAGAVVHGAHGFAAEIGHIRVEPGGVRCGCGQQGCWETVASGSAIDRLGRERIGPAVSGRDVVDAAHAGDATALTILTEVGTRLGDGIAGLVNVLDPGVVIVGGGAAAGAGDLLLEPARRQARITIEGTVRTCRSCPRRSAPTAPRSVPRCGPRRRTREVRAVPVGLHVQATGSARGRVSGGRGGLRQRLRL